MEHAIADVANHSEPSRRIPAVTAIISGLSSEMATCDDSRRDRKIEHGHTNLMTEMTPPLSAASPRSSNDYEKEPARLHLTAIASAPADLTFSTAYGIYSPRV